MDLFENLVGLLSEAIFTSFSLLPWDLIDVNDLKDVDDFFSILTEHFEDLLDFADGVLDIDGLERIEVVFVELDNPWSEEML